MRIKLTEFSGKSYKHYRHELETWSEVPELEKKEPGIAITVYFPEDDEFRIREKVFAKLRIDDLKTDTALDTLMTC